MRHVLGTVAAAATAAACLLTATAAPAVAQDRSDRPSAPAREKGLYAPTDLVLAMGRGADATTVAVERSVTLTCAPRPSGTHPDARAACAELRAADGRFGDLARPTTDAVCTKQWAPVTVFATGLWEGRRVDWSATFANGCTLNAVLAKSAALAF
ncbi:subtilase-type protease inhibitor [Streptomyces sp. B-S-A8]|uniref:Probable subtilase-type protease inhibitor n=1 Tax=Streptomyces solicavernae TaxID=3043614 RepID=A0ABT6RPI9_9ACTN|nr:subtilase-type protease inhibitor [Streptomyces sp. B-S-A8]MDI3386290.1 subtilase-type protease inhibitor [Streptomyces sp. B-S-A8]